MQTDVKRVVFAAPNQVNYQTEAETLTPLPDGIVIETRYSCISSGTELAKLTGLQPFSFPSQIGNRAIGRVVEAGPDCRTLKPGDLVFSHTPHSSHAQGNLLVAGLPDELDRPEASMLGLALVATCGVCVAKPAEGSWAVVTGAGLVGQLLSQILLARGVTPILVDRIGERLDRARACAIEHVVNAEHDEPTAAVMELTDGRGAASAFECTGIPALALLAASCCAQSGQLVLVGSPRQEHVADLTPLLKCVHEWRPHGDLTIRGAHEWKIPLYPSPESEFSQEQNLQDLSDLVLRGRLNLAPLMTTLCPPENCQQAYDQLRNDPQNNIGTVFDWTLA
tara:strand:+ start:4702 stop:5712 length:1011 start_codon:yes stop_codon:yes gene_type:complete